MRTLSFKRTIAVLGATFLQASALFGVVNITVQPAAMTTVADGSKITLSVTATSTLGNVITYTWKKRDGVNSPIVVKPESTSSAPFVIASAKATDAGNYFVTVRETQTNDTEDSTPDSAVVVNIRPKITVQPAAPATAIAEGSSTNFTVTVDAGGTPDFKYTWQKKSGTVYADAAAPVTQPGTSNTLNLVNAQLSTAGIYRVKIENPATNLTGIPIYSKDIVLKVNSRPVILTQPAATPTVVFGATGILKVVVGGNTPFTYRWLKNGVVIPKSNSASLTIKGTDSTAPGVAEGPGTYKVQIVNTFSPNYPGDPKTVDPFSVATFTESSDSVPVVIRKPKILTQPLKKTVSLMAGGVNDQFEVIMDTTGNEGVLTYQWYKDNKIIVGATNSVLSFMPVTWNDRGSYKVIIKNEVGAVTSASAVLTILSPPIILTQSPTTVFGPTKGTAKLFVTATGTTPLTYEWRFLPIIEAAGNTIPEIEAEIAVKTPIGKAAAQTLSNLSNLNHQGYYQCTVRNVPKVNNVPTNGAAVSTLIYLQVDDAPKITLQTTVLPYDNTITKGTPKIPAGKKLHLQVKATGADRSAPVGDLRANDLTARWFKNGVALVLPIPGLTVSKTSALGVATFELVVDVAVAGDSGKYSCEVSNLVSKLVSTALTITVAGPPTITGQPAPAGGIEESKIETTVVAAGGSPLLKYQWQKDSGGSWSNVPGKIAAKLTFTSSVLTDDGSYRCVVSNDFGSTTSNPVQIIVTPIPSPTLGPVGGISAVELFPRVARTGDKVRIYGQNLNYVKGVKFGGTEVATFVIESANSIVATVPATASLNDTSIQVNTKNPIPTNTVTLFRRSDDYENNLVNTTILTEKSGIITRNGDNRFVQANTADTFFGNVFYELVIPQISQVQVILSNGVIESGQPADLDLQVYRQTTTVNGSFVGPDGITLYPSRSTGSSARIGDDSVVITTTVPNQRVLVNVYGGLAVTTIGYVDFGPFNITVASAVLVSGSSDSQPTLTRLDPGWQTDGKNAVSKLGPVEDAVDENDVAMQFGGTDITSAEPVVIWQPTEGASAINGPVIASFDMSLEPGAAEGDDQFAWQITAQSGSPLAALWVNAADGSLRVVQADGTTTTSVQHITPGGGAHRFEITVDPVAHTWITLMDGVPVTEPVDLPAGSGFGEISAIWDLGADQTASGASVIFKHFRVEGVTTTP